MGAGGATWHDGAWSLTLSSSAGRATPLQCVTLEEAVSLL